MTIKRGPHYRGKQPARLRNAQNPQGPFIFFEIELLESPAFRCLSRDELMVLCRILMEHNLHNRTENGLLIVTYDDFAHWGIRRGNIRAALVGLNVLGFIKMQDGRGGKGRSLPNAYTLTFVGDKDGIRTNEWKVIQLPDGESLAAFRVVMRRRIAEAIVLDAKRRNKYRKPTRSKTPSKPLGLFAKGSATVDEMA